MDTRYHFSVSRKLVKRLLLPATVAVLLAFACMAFASDYNPWDDSRANDVIVKHTSVLEFSTVLNHTRNFQFSYTLPIENPPGHWCSIYSVNSNSRLSSDSLPDNSMMNCYDVTPSTSAAVKKYLQDYGISTDWAQKNKGKDR